MTTENHTARPGGVMGVLLSTVVVSAVLGVALALVGAVSSGRSAALGALVGAGIALVVFAFGSFTVHVVSALMPSASMLIALLTYALQVLVVLLVLIGLGDSPLLDETLSRTWLGVAVILVTIAWSIVQVWFTARLRTQAYDLDGAE